jgi:hypothetical protein
MGISDKVFLRKQLSVDNCRQTASERRGIYMSSLSKNLVITMLAVTMVSLSLGQLTFVPVSATVTPGGTIVVNIINSSDGLTAYKVDGITVTGQVGTIGLGNVPNPPFNSLSSSGILRNGTSNIWISGVFGNIGLGVPVVPAGTVVQDSFTISVSPSAMVGAFILIDDYAGANPFGGPSMSTTWNSQSCDMSSIAVQIVPEPVTFSLLGIGAVIALRRKKR